MTGSLTQRSNPSLAYASRDPFVGLVDSIFRNWPRTGALEDNGFSRGWMPAVDIRETADGYELIAELPGLSKDDIEISVDNGVLTLRGERRLSEDSSRESYRRVERSYGSFERTFSLPTGIDSGKVEASFENGLLTLALPKAETAKARAIKIK